MFTRPYWSPSALIGISISRAASLEISRALEKHLNHLYFAGPILY